MGYNASLKSLKVAEKLEYILAIELLSVYEAQPFVDGSLRRSSASRQVLAEIAQTVPEMKEDMYLYPISSLKERSTTEASFVGRKKDWGRSWCKKKV